jgi:hypothetical protein
MAEDDWSGVDWNEDAPFGGDGAIPEGAMPDGPARKSPRRNGSKKKEAGDFPLPFRWRKNIVSEYGPEDPAVRAVLLVLDTFMGKAGKCFPAYQSIADAAARSKRHVINKLDIAKRDGWLIIEENAGPGGVNVYGAAIPLPPEKQWTPVKRERPPLGDEATGEFTRSGSGKSPRRVIHLTDDPPY